MKQRMAVWLCMVSLVGLCACAPSKALPVGADAVLSAMLDEVDDGWPQGERYTRVATEEGGSYLSVPLLSALYGTAGRAWLAGEEAIVDDAALFLSQALHPAEMAVLRCTDNGAASSVARVCRSRLDALREHWKNTAWAAWVEGAEVSVEGHYVLVVVAKDPAPLLKAARRAARYGVR